MSSMLKELNDLADALESTWRLDGEGSAQLLAKQWLCDTLGDGRGMLASEFEQARNLVSIILDAIAGKIAGERARREAQEHDDKLDALYGLVAPDPKPAGPQQTKRDLLERFRKGNW
jgi:hypothetical protein